MGWTVSTAYNSSRPTSTYNDPVGRFLEQKSSRQSANFYTDGRRIYSYSWELAEWLDGKIYFTHRMFGAPYSSTTASHMSAVRHGLRGKAVNEDEPPEQSIRDIGKSLSYGLERGYSIAKFREAATHATYYSSSYPWPRVFAWLRQEIKNDARNHRAQYQGERAIPYTPSSIRAIRKYILAHERYKLALVDAYETAFNDESVRRCNPAAKVERPKELDKPAPQPVKIIECGYDGSAQDHNCGVDGILAWHMVPEDLRLSYGDGRQVREGETYAVQPNEYHKTTDSLVMCGYGMHASPTLRQACGWRQYPYATLVRLEGVCLKERDKICAERRTVLGIAAVNDLLPMMRRATAEEWDAIELEVYARMGVY